MPRAGTIPKPPDPKCSEAEFQRWVLKVARENGWKINHVYRSKLADGQWRTTCSVGWPDLTLVRDGRIVFAELKDHRGKVDPAQDEWLDSLASVDAAEVHVWRPADWRIVAKVLCHT